MRNRPRDTLTCFSEILGGLLGPWVSASSQLGLSSVQGSEGRIAFYICT